MVKFNEKHESDFANQLLSSKRTSKLILLIGKESKVDWGRDKAHEGRSLIDMEFSPGRENVSDALKEPMLRKDKSVVL